MNKRILLFSSVRKPLEIVELTVKSWLEMKRDNLEIDFLLLDDNTDKDSSNYLKKLKEDEKVILSDFKVSLKDDFKGQHIWTYDQVDRITQIKNYAIEYAKKHTYDYLFLPDSDLVLNKNTLNHLLSTQKDFVFEVFWTLFYGEDYYKPNAWDFHNWSYYNEETILKLVQKGTYKVGGGGACTLLSRKILESGLNFDRLQSLNYKGEDRHFCTRAQALGYDIFVDTHYPAYHIFNDSQAPEANEWLNDGSNRDFFMKWLNNDWAELVKKSFHRQRGFMKDLKFFIYSMMKSIQRSYNISFKK